jgi:hypothetical protein
VSLRAIRRSRRSRSSSRWSRVRRCGGGMPTPAYRQVRGVLVGSSVLVGLSLGSTFFRSRPPPRDPPVPRLVRSVGLAGLICFLNPALLHIKDCPTGSARTSRHGGRCSRRSLIACVLGSLATVGVLRPLMVSRRMSVRQLRGPPFGRDDPHR